MADYIHGVRVLEINEGTRPIRTVATAVIGMVCTADDADDAVFPLNTAILLTNPIGALASAGTTGTLKKSLAAIALQAKPFTIVVRVAEGADEAATTTNVIGGVDATGKYTGMNALLSSQAKFGFKPRILGAPGLDTQAVTNAFAALSQQLRGFLYGYCWDCATKEDAIAYRAQFGQREFMPIWPNYLAWDSDASAEVEIYSTAFALGLRAKLDAQVGWHKTLSNAVVNGPTGIAKDVFFDLQDAASDSNLLNASEVTTLIQRAGYRFWGSRTAEAPGGYFPFENYTRTAQVLADTMAEAQFSYNDVPMHPSLVKDQIASINAKFRELTRAGYILGGSAWFDEEYNTPEQLKDGQLAIDYDYTPVPPLENITLRQRITDRYLMDFANKVNA